MKDLFDFQPEAPPGAPPANPKHEFNLDKALEARDAGMDRAALKRKQVLSEARQLAVKIAEADPNKECDADRVQEALLKSGFTPGDLGPAAGSIFRGSRWEFADKWKNSARVSNHAAAIRVWRLKAPPVEPPKNWTIENAP